MAKPMDMRKLDQVKRATMELMVESGYKSITVSRIANRANVSPGYLYSHYASINDLIEELLDTTYESFVDYMKTVVVELTSIREFVKHFVQGMIDFTMTDPLLVQFVTALMDDHAYFNERIKNDNELGIEEYIVTLLKCGHDNLEIGQHIDALEFVAIMIRLPLNYLNLRFLYADKYGSICSKDVSKLSRIIINALQ